MAAAAAAETNKNLNCTHTILCCEDPTYESITEVLYTVKQEIVDIGKRVLSNMLYGTNVGDYDSRFIKLEVFHNLLDRLRVALVKQGSLCLNCKEVQYIVEGARRVVGISCKGNNIKGLEIDSSRIGEWAIANPFCISPNNWDKCMYEVNKMLGINVVQMGQEKACDLSYSLITKKIDCDIFLQISKMKDCTVKFNIFTDEKQCNLNYTGLLTKKDCKASFNTLVKTSKCNVGFHDYTNIVNCGVDTRLIKQIYSCGMAVKFSKARSCPILVTADGKEYYFSDLDVHNESDIWRLLSVPIA